MSNSRDGLKHHSRGAEPITGAAAVEGRLGEDGPETPANGRRALSALCGPWGGRPAP